MREEIRAQRTRKAAAEYLLEKDAQAQLGKGWQLGGSALVGGLSLGGAVLGAQKGKKAADRRLAEELLRKRMLGQEDAMKEAARELLLKEAAVAQEVAEKLPRWAGPALLGGSALAGLLSGGTSGAINYLSARSAKTDPKLREEIRAQRTRKAAAEYLLEKDAQAQLGKGWGLGGAALLGGLGFGGAVLGAQKGKKAADRRLAKELLQKRMLGQEQV